MTDESTILRAEEVSKRYGSGAAELAALRGLSLEVDRGEFIALRGPSGCGKSTLLHILGAMDRPTTGRVWLSGRSLETLTPEALAIVRRRHVGFVFQAFNLLPTLRVEENVGLPLLLDGVSERETAGRVRTALAEVGLEPRARHLPSELSGGEMQRVAIARAVAVEPDLLLADEPTGSLDSATGKRILELLARLNTEKGLTILMATHSAEAAGYASRTLYLRDGQQVTESDSHVVPATL